MGRSLCQARLGRNEARPDQAADFVSLNRARRDLAADRHAETGSRIARRNDLGSKKLAVNPASGKAGRKCLGARQTELA